MDRLQGTWSGALILTGASYDTLNFLDSESLKKLFAQLLSCKLALIQGD